MKKPAFKDPLAKSKSGRADRIMRANFKKFEKKHGLPSGRPSWAGTGLTFGRSLGKPSQKPKEAM